MQSDGKQKRSGDEQELAERDQREECAVCHAGNERHNTREVWTPARVAEEKSADETACDLGHGSNARGENWHAARQELGLLREESHLFFKPHMKLGVHAQDRVSII